MVKEVHDKLNENITIKKWIVVLLIPILVTLMGFSINTVASLTTTNNKVDYHQERIDQNCEEIDYIQKNKVDKEVYNENLVRVYVILDRIEAKLDNMNK